MGLQRFEIGSPFRPIFESLQISQGIDFWANNDLAVFLMAQEGFSIKNYFSKNDVQAIGFHFPE